MDFRMKKSGDPGMPGIGCQRFVCVQAITWIWVAKFPSKRMPSFWADRGGFKSMFSQWHPDGNEPASVGWGGRSQLIYLCLG